MCDDVFGRSDKAARSDSMPIEAELLPALNERVAAVQAHRGQCRMHRSERINVHWRSRRSSGELHSARRFDWPRLASGAREARFPHV
eukprot:IDg15188t1